MTEKKSCECMSDIEKKILEQAKEDSVSVKGYKVIESEWERQSFYPVVRLFNAFIIKSTFTKKDGTESKPRNHHVSVYHSFCPFCGNKYPSIK